MAFPFGVLKRIAKARDLLATSCGAVDPRREKKLVKKATKVLKKAQKIRSNVARKGVLSADCASALEEMLAKAHEQCRSWRSAF